MRNKQHFSTRRVTAAVTSLILIAVMLLSVCGIAATAAGAGGSPEAAQTAGESEHYTHLLSYHETLPGSGTYQNSIHNTVSVTFDASFFRLRRPFITIHSPNCASA